MPGCVLRAFGTAFDVDAFLSSSTFQPSAVFRTGEPRTPGSPHLSKTGGFNLAVSDASGGCVPVQIREAHEFVRRNGPELEVLANTPGLESLVLDFGWDFPCTGTQFNTFPAEFLTECGSLGIGIEVSVYASKHAT